MVDTAGILEEEPGRSLEVPEVGPHMRLRVPFVVVPMKKVEVIG